MIARIAHLAGAAMLLSACGGDGDRTTEQAATSEEGAETSPENAPPEIAITGSDSDAEAVDEMIEIDAEPEMFVNDAQGFSTDPVDTTEGFDPTPADPQGFVPDPAAPETPED